MCMILMEHAHSCCPCNRMRPQTCQSVSARGRGALSQLQSLSHKQGALQSSSCRLLESCMAPEQRLRVCMKCVGCLLAPMALLQMHTKHQHVA